VAISADTQDLLGIRAYIARYGMSAEGIAAACRAVLAAGPATG
jgi:hypothetical protein